MVTNDKIGPRFPAPMLVPLHASYRASMIRSCVVGVQFFNLGRGGGAGVLVGARNPGLALLTLHSEWVVIYQ